MERLRQKYQDSTNFLIVYIKEAHPEDEWQMESNVKQGIVFKQPKTMKERMQMAQTFVESMEVKMPTLVDDITNPANACYAAWPERIYVVNTDGSIVYKGDTGPRGYKPKELDEFLQGYVGGSGAS